MAEEIAGYPELEAAQKIVRDWEARVGNELVAVKEAFARFIADCGVCAFTTAIGLYVGCGAETCGILVTWQEDRRIQWRGLSTWFFSKLRCMPIQR
jgi:hypothetical protein